MAERKIWKEQEDRILKELYEDRQVTKWSEISKIMEKEYGIIGRNGKQCRERYHNHLDHDINKTKWTLEEEKLLIQLHNQHGNKWALISKHIKGRTDNCVKNMLYSKLRKSVRFLNRIIEEKYKKVYKEIKINFIYRLSEITQKYYKNSHQEVDEYSAEGLKLKNRLLELSFEPDDLDRSEDEIQQLKSLIEIILNFNKLTRKTGGYRKLNPAKIRARINEMEKEIEHDIEFEEHEVKEKKDKIYSPEDDDMEDEMEDGHNLKLEIKKTRSSLNENLKDQIVSPLIHNSQTHRMITLRSNYPAMQRITSNVSDWLMYDPQMEKPITLEDLTFIDLPAAATLNNNFSSDLPDFEPRNCRWFSNTSAN